MFRRLGVAISVLALVLGFVAAPYTHVHQSARVPAGAHDDHHSAPAPLVHAHATPHSDDDSRHPPVEGNEDTEQKVWSPGGFVFQPASAAYEPLPSVAVSSVTRGMSSGSWVVVRVMQPGAHAPPPRGGSSPRAPPSAPAAFS